MTTALPTATSPGPGPPAGFVDRLEGLTQRIAVASGRLGHPVVLDAPSTLTERSGPAGLQAHLTVSCGGATHLVATADGWIAVSLARPDDLDLVPAWLGTDPDPRPPNRTWDEVHARCRHRSTADLVDRGVLLGLPIAALGSQCAGDRPPVITTTVTERPLVTPTTRAPRVADLSALWAGPLCGRILAEAGADVRKIESTTRPDGARRGSAAFFELLNGGKRDITVDLGSDCGVDRLLRILRSSDVVIESSRPRSLAQLGIDAPTLLADRHGPRVWVSITGHGREDRCGHRVAFGDDAAVAGGLVAWTDGRPSFFGDAIADPLSGLMAAASALTALHGDGTVLIDVSMAAVAAHFAGPTGRARADVPPASTPVGP